MISRLKNNDIKYKNFEFIIERELRMVAEKLLIHKFRKRQNKAQTQMPKLEKSDPASVGVNDTYLNQDLNKFENHLKKVLDYHILYMIISICILYKINQG